MESHSTMSGGRLSILSSNGSVHQFSMPNLVLEPLTKQLKELAAKQPNSDDVVVERDSGDQGKSSDAASLIESLRLDELAPQLSFDPFANNIDDKDAVIITVVSNDGESTEKTP